MLDTSDSTQTISHRSRFLDRRILSVLIIIVSVIIWTNSTIFDGQAQHGNALALDQTNTPIACTFKCNISTERYGFGVSCEKGQLSTIVSDSTHLAYDASGNVSSITVDVNQVLTYADSKHSYSVKGKIQVSPLTYSVAYDISATGGVFGDQAQQCHSGSITQSTEAPASTASSPSATLAPSVAPPPTVSPPALADLPAITAANAKNLGMLTAFRGHTDMVLSVAFSADSQVLASLSADKTIRLWNVATGKATATFKTSDTKMAFSPDGNLLATVGDKTAIHVLDASTGKQLAELGIPRKINAIAFSPNSKTVASADEDGLVQLWDAASYTLVTKMNVPQHTWGSPAVLAIAFSPDGKLLATGNRSGYVILWDSTTGKQVRAMETNGVISAVAFSPDGNLVAASNDVAISGKDTIQLWDMNGQKVQELPAEDAAMGFVLAFSPDSSILAVATLNYNKGVNMLKVPSGAVLRFFASSREFKLAIAFSPDGRLFALGTDYPSTNHDNDRSQPLQIWAIE